MEDAVTSGEAVAIGDAVTMGNAVTIGRGRTADIEACVALWLRAVEARGGHPAPAGTAERCRAKFVRATLSFAVARSDDDGIVGFGLVTAPGTGAPGDPEDAAYLALLAVSAGRQGDGVGSRLLETITAETRAAGHPELVLHVLAGNAAAVALYESRGWRAYGEPLPHALSGELSQTYVLGGEPGR